jgi:hypothetical protein
MFNKHLQKDVERGSVEQHACIMEKWFMSLSKVVPLVDNVDQFLHEDAPHFEASCFLVEYGIKFAFIRT